MMLGSDIREACLRFLKKELTSAPGCNEPVKTL